MMIECAECNKIIRLKKQLVILELHNEVGEEWLTAIHKKCKKEFMNFIAKD